MYLFVLIDLLYKYNLLMHAFINISMYLGGAPRDILKYLLTLKHSQVSIRDIISCFVFFFLFLHVGYTYDSICIAWFARQRFLKY